MRQADDLQEEIEEGFENVETLTQRPEEKLRTAEEQEEYLRKSRKGNVKT